MSYALKCLNLPSGSRAIRVCGLRKAGDQWGERRNKDGSGRMQKSGKTRLRFIIKFSTWDNAILAF